MLLAFVALLAVPPVASTAEVRTWAADSASWIGQSFRRLVVGADPHSADRMLAQIREIADVGADTVIFTGHLWGEAWYPSRLAARAQTLSVQDAVRQGTESARARGLRPVVYVGAPLVQKALRERMDWLQRRPDGEPIAEDRPACLLSGFGDWLIQYLVEMSTHAPIAGLWLDGYPQAAVACACPHCAAAYRREAGSDLPTSGSPDDAGFRRYTLWWAGKMEDHARRLVAALHAARPGIALFANTSVGRSPDYWRHSPQRLSATLDGPSLEQFWHVDRPGDPLGPTFAIGMQRSAAAGKPVEVFVPLLPHMVDATTRLPWVETAARTYTVLAHGAAPQLTYGAATTETFVRLMREIRRREPFLRGAVPLRYAAILCSERTLILAGRGQPEKEYLDEVRGWLRALTEAHLPVQLVSDAQLEEDDLRGYAVLVLPAAAVLSDTARRNVERFVKRGGGLLATSVTSLASSEGDLGESFALGDLLGIRYAERRRAEPLPAFVAIKPASHPLARGEWVDGSVWRQWIALGHQIGAVGLPGRYLLIEAAPSTAAAWTYADGKPAVVCTEQSGGKTVYFGPEVGAAYYRFSYPYLRRLMEHAALWAGGDPPVRVRGSLALQATYWRQSTSTGSRIVVHLLNEATSYGRASLPNGALPIREEILPISGATIQLRQAAGKLRLEPGGAVLQMKTLGSGASAAALPPLGLHQMVVIEPPTRAAAGPSSPVRRAGR